MLMILFFYLKKIYKDLIINNKIDATEQMRITIRNVLNTFLNALPEDMRSILHK